MSVPRMQRETVDGQWSHHQRVSSSRKWASTATIAASRSWRAGLRDAGFHVIYAGLWQSPEAVARAVADEDADWLGLSLLSGAHMTLVPRVLDALRQAGVGRCRRAGRRDHSRGGRAASCISLAWPASSARARRSTRSRNFCARRNTRPATARRPFP